MQNLPRKFIRRFQHFVSVRSSISLLMQVALPDEIRLDHSKLKPRGKSIDGTYYSWMHEFPYADLPSELLELMLKQWSRIQKSFGGRAIVRPATIYRTSHIPKSVEDTEVFAEAWHRDTTGIPNVQIFVLLQDTEMSHGPLQYISSDKMKKAKSLAPELQNKKLRSKNMEIPNELVSNFTGPRGKVLLLNTYSNFHKASIPHVGKYRDMISIVFEPIALTEWDKKLLTSKRQIKKILKTRKVSA